MSKLLNILWVLLLLSCDIQYPSYDYTAIMEWVHETVEYKYDDEGAWQTPEETLKLKTGDCEDFAILMLRAVYDTYGVKGKFVVLEVNEIFDARHGIVEVDIFYDPTNNRSSIKPESEIVCTWSYDTVMKKADRNYRWRVSNLEADFKEFPDGKVD